VAASVRQRRNNNRMWRDGWEKRPLAFHPRDQVDCAIKG
jgi:hypothetical protein